MAKVFAVGGELSGWYINFRITAMPTASYAYALQLFLNEPQRMQRARR